MVFVLTGFVADSGKEDVRVPDTLRVTENDLLSFPSPQSEMTAKDPDIPWVGTRLIGFREALAFKESGGNYFSINTLGYLGKYQFGIGTLQLMGVYNATKFLEDPELQEKVFASNLSRNKWILRRDIPRFTGKRVKGVEITESGILAAAHLAGAGNVKKFLRSGGTYDIVDAYGTSISEYLAKFRGFDTSSILPVRNPRVL